MSKESKKKILFIVLEIESASGICTMNVAEELQRRGWMVDILSQKIENPQFDRKSINITEIEPKTWVAWNKKISGNRKVQSIFTMLYKMQIAATIFMWPWNAPIFSLRLYGRAKKMHDTYKFDCVVPVYSPLDPLIACFLLKMKCNDLTVIPYFLDSLSAGSTPKLLSEKVKIKKGIRWERRLLKNMDGIIYMKSSEQHHMKYSFQENYFKNVAFLDIPMLKLVEDNKCCRKKYDTKEVDKIHITYVGTLPLSVRNPEYAIKILDSVKDIEIEVNIVGETGDIRILKNIHVKKLNINFVGRVSHEKALEYIKEADILLNIGNNISGMVPSKIFEYISYYKPILSFAPISEEPSIPYLMKYPAACIVFEKDDFTRNLRKVEEFVNNIPECRFTNEELKQMYYLNTPECHADYISSKA